MKKLTHSGLNHKSTIKLNGASQPVSIEYKMVHGINQVVFGT